MHARHVALAAVGGLLFPLATSAGHLEAKLATRLTRTEPIPVLIELTGEIEVEDLRELATEPRRAALVERLRRNWRAGHQPLKEWLRAYGPVVELWHINALAATLPPAVIRRLAATAEVEAIRLDGPLPLAAPPPGAPAATADWNLSAIGAEHLWADGLDGSTVTIATLDTGVDPNHPDLAARRRGGAHDWFDPYGQHPQPYDAVGHGTQVLGLALGGAASGNPIGVAPGARWIAAKIFDDRGASTLSAIHAAFQWLLDPDGDPAVDDLPDVVVGAWGLLDAVGGCDREFESDVRLLKLADVAVAFAAGNTGPYSGSSVSPGDNPGSFAVGAVDQAGNLADFSAHGPSACDGGLFPHLSAPGVNVRTTDLTYGGVIPASYTWVSGTSFAAAHLGGALALLRGAFPAASVADLEAALTGGARDGGSPGPDHAFGHGLIDLPAARAYLTDADGDGHPAGSDCDDTHPAVHPGAAEVLHDGTDQDCNGYDLTIGVSARYRPQDTTLKVTATSALGARAALEVAGVGPMQWHKKAKRWELAIVVSGARPRSVTVRGVEGSVDGKVR